MQARRIIARRARLRAWAAGDDVLCTAKAAERVLAAALADRRAHALVATTVWTADDQAAEIQIAWLAHDH